MSKTTDRLHIAFFVPGMPFDGQTPYQKALGGSETAGWAVARELARRGHRVRMFSNLPQGPGMFDGVQYLSAGDAISFFANIPTDVCIAQRVPEFFSNQLASKLNLLWCHDLALGRQFNQFRSTTWNVNKCVVVSEYMKQQYESVYQMPKSFFEVKRNGIFLEDFPLESLARDRKRLVYSARPERGLDVLLDRIIPEVFAADPGFTLALYGYDNMTESWRDFYAEIGRKCERFGERVMFMGHLPKRELYEQYVESGIYVYPTPSPALPGFNEVSCITAMEVQAAGMPIVASNRGALSETIHPNAGVLIDGDPMSDEYRDAFVDAVLQYANSPTKYDNAAKAGREHAKGLSWEAVAEQWETMLFEMIAQQNDNPLRLAYHFYRRSDIFAAEAALAQVTDSNELVQQHVTQLRATINREYPFRKDDDDLRAWYLSHGADTTKRLEAAGPAAYAPYFEQTDEVRFHVIEEILAESKAETILDYGCGHGWGTVYWYNKVGRRWTGIDLDPGAVAWAKLMAEHHAVPPKAVEFVVGDSSTLAEEPKTPASHFDCAIVSEVLEHTIKPWEVLTAVESRVKPGGLMLLTVPYGPAEYGTANWLEFRNHLWEFDYEDLCQMLANKRKLKITATLDHLNEVTGEPCGFHTVRYIADHSPIAPLDMERKLRVQVPRQTVSATIMAGFNCEETLRWCLSPLQWVFDEIVIANTGMSPEALAIAEAFNCTIVDAPDPRMNGFEVPRNIALENTVTDWVFWIDTDERLLNPPGIVKYCRENAWQGASMRQHHFSIDAGFSPDMPVRLYRTRPLDGKTMRHVGAIHEHPELGLNEGPGPVLLVSDLNIAHVGYLDESIRRRKFLRNQPMLELDQKRYPDRVLQKHFIMRDLMLLNMYELQQTEGKITDIMRERAHEVIKLYREHFLGKKIYANIDPAQYYSEALRVLGQGIDIEFGFRANRDGVGDKLNGSSRRVANTEEAIAEITEQVKARMADFDKAEW